MKYIFYVLLAFCPSVCYAQQGHYFLSHYTPADERIDHASYDITQDVHGLLYFATRSGILRFDGKTWELIPGQGAVYDTEINREGEIYWAGANGFGQLKEGPDGSREITVLSPQGERDFYQVLVVDKAAYFLNDRAVFVWQKDQPIQTISTSKLSGAFTYLFELYGTPYISTDHQGVFTLEGPKLKPVSFNLKEKIDIVSASRHEDTYILVTTTNRLFMCGENRSLREIQLSERQYLEASVIVSAAWVNHNVIALGTLRGGVVFINPFTGEEEAIINYNTGLPDNEVYALGADRNRNIWVAHDYGFTRIAPFLPFRSFSHYDGLKGNLLCAITYNNQVYVGTSLGLFKLVKEEVYDEIVYYVDVVTRKEAGPVPEKAEQSTTVTETEEVVPDVPEKKKRGFLRFLKRNRDKAEPEENQQPGEQNDGTPPAATEPAEEYVTHKLKKTERILRSAQYAYKKVQGIDAKITHLVEVDGRLIASGLAGAYEVNDLLAVSFLEEPVRFIFARDDNLLFASTYADNVRTFRRNDTRWTRTNMLDDLDDQITYIFEGPSDELWLCGLDKLYRLEIMDQQLRNIHTIELNNPDFSRTIGVRWKDDVVLANADGFFRLDHQTNSIVRIDTLPAPNAYFASRNELWYHDDRSWTVLGKTNTQRNIQWLNIFSDVRFISATSHTGDIWAITSSNELYKFFSENLNVSTKPYPLILKSVTQAEQKLSIGEKLKVVQDKGLLTFEVIHPDYTGVSIEYRYFLKGINDTWSDWSQGNSRISFPYLPPGSYSLMVQSRDAFGSVQEMDAVSFNIQPPFWKSPWFYALEFTLFTLLVMLSFKLSIRYRLVSRVLSLLTIILLIEFIQTVAGSTFATNSSPIIDFAIQVAVAFMILPVEGFLRNLMFKSTSRDSRLYKVISDLDRQEKQRKSAKMS